MAEHWIFRSMQRPSLFQDLLEVELLVLLSKDFRYWDGIFYQWKETYWAPLGDDDIIDKLTSFMAILDSQFFDTVCDLELKPKVDKEVSRMRKVFKNPNARKVVLTNLIDKIKNFSKRDGKWMLPNDSDTLGERQYLVLIVSQNPPNRKLVSFSNGVLCLESKQFFNHSKDYFVIYQVLGSYNPIRLTPFVQNWLKTLSKRDPKTLFFLRLAAFLSLAPQPELQIAFFLHGAGGTGKSLFSDFLLSLIPEAHVLNASVTDLQDRFALSNLRAISFMLFDDLDHNLSRLGPGTSSTVKRLSAKTTLRVRPLYLPARKVTPNLTVLINSNRTLELSSDGLGRRFIGIELTNRVKIDPTFRNSLISDIKHEELLKNRSSFLSWVFAIPLKSVIQCADARLVNSKVNTMATFFPDVVAYDAKGWVSRRILYVCYKSYCNVNGITLEKEKVFYEFIRDTFISGGGKEKYGVSEVKRNVYGFKGLTLKAGALQNFMDLLVLELKLPVEKKIQSEKSFKLAIATAMAKELNEKKISWFREQDRTIQEDINLSFENKQPDDFYTENCGLSQFFDDF